jgi:hypothetical protein
MPEIDRLIQGPNLAIINKKTSGSHIICHFHMNECFLQTPAKDFLPEVLGIPLWR